MGKSTSKNMLGVKTMTRVLLHSSIGKLYNLCGLKLLKKSQRTY